MRKIKVLTVFGTRPEAVKMAPLVKILEQRTDFESVVCVTAQHRELLDMVLDLFEVKPDYDLNLMQHGQTVSQLNSRVLTQMDEVLVQANPDLVLVHGDTTTTFAAALAAFYRKIPVGHVEAGLRSGNIYSPFPEEMNRRLTSSLTSLHFAPTQGNFDCLVREGIPAENIYITGNTVIDALISMVEKDYSFENPLLNSLDFEGKKVIVLTCHRRENWGQPMESIFLAVRELVAQHQNVEVVFPVHSNPAIGALAQKILGDLGRVQLISPLEYKDFANLLNRSYFVLTDSGGIQEEAPSLGKPVIVFRTETERPEAVAAGTVKVVGIEKEAVFQGAHELLSDPEAYARMANAVNPYGTGGSSVQIAEIIANWKNLT